MVNKKEAVLHWLTVLGNELEYLIQSPLQEKYKVMLLMVYIDIFSQTWDLVQQPHSRSQKDRFMNWSNRFFFVANDENENKELKDLEPLDSLKLYHIRNSLLHFGGLPSFEIPVFISTYNKSDFMDKFKKQIDDFYNNNNHIDRSKEILILYPNLLYRRAFTAFINTLKEITTLFPDGSNEEDNLMTILFQKLKENHALPLQTSISTV